MHQQDSPSNRPTPVSADTREANQRQDHFGSREAIWLFGYGSLIWKADFAYRARRPALIEGYARRFWQGSHDHRGTPEAPGRVATLIHQPGARCLGMAYLIGPEVLAPLDLREKNGYLRERVTLHFLDETNPLDENHPRDDSNPLDDHHQQNTDSRLTVDALATARTAEGLVYIAGDANPAYLGDASDDSIAEQIAHAHGPSGPNSDYLLHLADALHAMGGEDDHVFGLAAALRRRMRQAATHPATTD